MDSACKKLLADFSLWMTKIFEKAFKVQYLLHHNLLWEISPMTFCNYLYRIREQL